MRQIYCTVWFLAATVSAVLVPVHGVGAVDERGLVFTVTPPLFQISLRPGETWTSGIQVVNGNPYDLTVFADPVLFRPGGEEGRPEFYAAPAQDASQPGTDDSTLAGWITVPQGAVTVPREQTEILPVAIVVPEDAAPGGHYAAILIGNRAPQGVGEGVVNVASSIASLIFLRVSGDVDERGRIRDFVTEQSVYERAEARLSLRFENQGNVHLQPQGDITIYNMFNKKRGYIAVNQAKDYGNVLPGSMRRYTFSWQSDAGSWDIGRYRAEVTLGYGSDQKQFAAATIYFWVLPILPLLQIVSALIGLVLFVGWSVRAYVRKALRIERARVLEQHPQSEIPTQQEPRLRLETLMRPIQVGMIDLRPSKRTKAKVTEGIEDTGMSQMVSRRARVWHFARTYAAFLLFALVMALAWFVASTLVADVLTYERPFEGVQERVGTSENPNTLP